MRKAFAAAVAVTVCAVPAVGAAAESGLEGTVTRACAGQICAAGTPLRATLVFSRPGETKRARSAANGAYHVALSPGRYRVTTIPRNGITAPRVRPGFVKVRAGQIDEIDFTVTLGVSHVP